MPKELYQFPQIISVLSYANVIKCANGETLQIFRGCNPAETARMKSIPVIQKVRLNQFRGPRSEIERPEITSRIMSQLQVS